MSSWSALLELAAGEPEFELSSADEFSLSVVCHDQAGEHRAQRVWGRRFEAWSEPMLELRSAFAAGGSVPAEACLRHNLDLSVGAIAVHGDVLVIIYKLSLSSMTAAGLLDAIHRVGAEADALESRSGRDRF